jgi:DNA invertase Pin-like site-specific DNA recombinase
VRSTASAKEYEVVERFREEGESAKTADRTELQKLLNYCRTHKGKVHFVIVYNLTRFAREKYDHFGLRALLKSLGISPRSVTEPTPSALSWRNCLESDS